MTIELRAADGGTVQVSPEIVQAFKAGFRGPVMTPDAPDYEETRKVWNAMIDRRPGLIVRCTGTQDVVNAVRFARQHRFLVSVRGGGHNIAGLAVCDGGLMIDLSLMKGVWVDPKARTARAQAGCTLGDVDRETQLHGLAAVLGFVSTTGIAGLTTGGGFGYLTRRLGWTCDNLVSMEVVTAEGKLVRAAADENADLFWALRGGGGGNGGIVTDFTFATVPAPTVTIFSLRFPASRTARVLRAWSTWMDAAPNQLSALCAITAAPTPTNRVTGTWTGPAGALSGHLASLIAAVGASPTSRTTHTYGYLDAMKYFAGCLNETVAACKSHGRESFRAASRMLVVVVTTVGRAVISW